MEPYSNRHGRWLIKAFPVGDNRPMKDDLRKSRVCRFFLHRKPPKSDKSRMQETSFWSLKFGDLLLIAAVGFPARRLFLGEMCQRNFRSFLAKSQVSPSLNSNNGSVYYNKQNSQVFASCLALAKSKTPIFSGLCQRQKPVGSFRNSTNGVSKSRKPKGITKKPTWR
jgi:hypothetical protein